MNRTQPLRKRRKTKRASRRRLADMWWSRIVRMKGVCEVCGTREGPMQAAHIVPRRFSNVRWDLSNGFCACVPCHAHFTANPFSFDEWVEGRIGAEKYHELKMRAQERLGPPDYDAIIEGLKGKR